MFALHDDFFTTILHSLPTNEEPGSYQEHVSHHQYVSVFPCVLSERHEVVRRAPHQEEVLHHKGCYGDGESAGGWTAGDSVGHLRPDGQSIHS